MLPSSQHAPSWICEDGQARISTAVPAVVEDPASRWQPRLSQHTGNKVLCARTDSIRCKQCSSVPKKCSSRVTWRGPTQSVSMSAPAESQEVR